MRHISKAVRFGMVEGIPIAHNAETWCGRTGRWPVWFGLIRDPLTCKECRSRYLYALRKEDK